MTIQDHHTVFGAKALIAGFRVSYHTGEINHCPGCAGTHWIVGRSTAQCVRCDTALPLALEMGGMQIPIHGFA